MNSVRKSIYKNNIGDLNSINGNVMEWTIENELIIVEWCDIAQCYKWMNSQAHISYSRINILFTIPAIVLSTISGTASFAQQSIPLAYQTYAPMIIGGINIFIGIVTTIQQYLKITELNEAHRVASISWDKYARNIRIELAKAPHERMDVTTFIRMNREEFDRLMETSPTIPMRIVHKFRKTFKGKKGTREREIFDEIKKPDICNIIVSANNYRHHWYKDFEKNVDNVINLELKKSSSSYSIEEKNEDKDKNKDKNVEKYLNDFKSTLEKNILESLQKIKHDKEKINKFIIDFISANNRQPLTTEIIENMKNEISEELLNKFLIENSIENLDV